MDRREFVLRTVASAGALGSGGCGGSPSDTATNGAKSPQSPQTPGAPVTPVAPASMLSNGPAQFLTWDAGSGPSREFWSLKLQLPWANPGVGDWLDARQQTQGTQPFAVTTVVPGAVELNVTALVERWLTTGANRGFYVRSGEVWPSTFAGRNHTTLAARPALRIEANGSVVVLACISNANWTPSSYEGKDSRSTFTVAASTQFAALQFDLSKVVLPIRRATLVLTCLSLRNPGPLEVMELNPPEFHVGKGSRVAQPGIAQTYVYDRGLGAHPGVLFAGDFSDMSKARWQVGTVAAGSTQTRDARTGTTYLTSLIPAGQLLGCDLERNLVGATPGGTPDKVETELWARYYVLLEDDWGSEVDANKMPGWDGRFGWWNAVGYWQATTGNGGERPTGLKVRNTAANRWEYEGASMRGHGGMRANDGNPYDNLFWLGSYIYHLDQPTNYGEPICWTGTVIDKGRWHCIEHHIRMNSVAGPFDGTGNGVAANDGHYTVWVDGVQVFRRTNFRWRKHPEMGIQGFWLNWYHGGTAAAPRNMHFRMDSVVVARAYIGPRGET